MSSSSSPSTRPPRCRTASPSTTSPPPSQATPSAAPGWTEHTKSASTQDTGGWDCRRQPLRRSNCRQFREAVNSACSRRLAFRLVRWRGRGPGAYLLGQGGDVLRGCGLDDAVSQVEDEGPSAQGAQDAVGLGVERGAAGGQELGVEVALHAAAQAVLYLLRGPFEGDRGVQADAVRAGR